MILFKLFYLYKYFMEVLNIKGVISPKLETGSFEVLWSSEISFFKQFKDKLKLENFNFASEIVDSNLAFSFYQKQLGVLKNLELKILELESQGLQIIPIL